MSDNKPTQTQANSIKFSRSIARINKLKAKMQKEIGRICLTEILKQSGKSR